MEEKIYFVECDIRYRDFSCKFSTKGDRDDIKYLIRLANRAFNEVEVMDENNGEVLHSEFTDSEIFVQRDEIPNIIREIFHNFPIR